MKTNIYFILLITVLLFAVNACRHNSADVNEGAGAARPEDTAPVGQSATTTAATTAPTVENISQTELAGGASVPAKRENLTAADRAVILRAVGLTDYADRSPEFVKWWNESYGTPLKNAGVTFHSLGEGKYLVEIMVDQGANQSTSVYALYQETAADKATAKLLELEGYNSKTGEIVKSGTKEQVGAPAFDEQNKILIITAAARGIGGCGERVKYKIADDRASLIEARYQECSNEMPPPEKWKLVSLKQPGSSNNDEIRGGNGVILNEDDFKQMSPAHALVLKRWLRQQRNNMRPLRQDENSASSQKYFRQDHPNDDPFYAVGDFNSNGIEDFAVILTYFAPDISPETKRPLNALAVFEMSPANKVSMTPKAAYFSDQIDSLFIISGKGKDYLAISSYPSDDGFYLVPKGNIYKTKVMVDF